MAATSGLAEVIVGESRVFSLEAIEANSKIMNFFFFKGERDER